LTNPKTAGHCGFINEIYEECDLTPVPEDVDPEVWVDTTTTYHGIKLNQHYLLEA
jgi:hypothetical protein